MLHERDLVLFRTLFSPLLNKKAAEKGTLTSVLDRRWHLFFLWFTCQEFQLQSCHILFIFYFYFSKFLGGHVWDFGARVVYFMTFLSVSQKMWGLLFMNVLHAISATLKCLLISELQLHEQFQLHFVLIMKICGMDVES